MIDFYEVMGSDVCILSEVDVLFVIFQLISGTSTQVSHWHRDTEPKSVPQSEVCAVRTSR